MIGDSIVSSPQDGLDKLTKHARGVLIVLAALQLASAGLLWIAVGVTSVAALAPVVFVGLVFIGLAVLARREPLPAISIGLGVWLLGLIGNALVDPATLVQGILLKGLIAVMFYNGISTALTYNNLRRTLGGSA